MARRKGEGPSAPCDFEDCGRPMRLKGLCNSHYQMQRRGEELRPIRVQRAAAQKVIDVDERRQTCSTCGQRKPFEDFQKFLKRGKVVRFIRCKQCASSPEQKVKHRDRKYSLEPGEWERMFEAQGRACKICCSDSPGHKNGWQTDHDHACCPGQGSCGQCVRGILCHWCNINLSWYERHTDSIEGYVMVPQSMPYEASALRQEVGQM